MRGRPVYHNLNLGMVNTNTMSWNDMPQIVYRTVPKNTLGHYPGRPKKSNQEHSRHQRWVVRAWVVSKFEEGAGGGKNIRGNTTTLFCQLSDDYCEIFMLIVHGGLQGNVRMFKMQVELLQFLVKCSHGFLHDLARSGRHWREMKAPMITAQPIIWGSLIWEGEGLSR